MGYDDRRLAAAMAAIEHATRFQKLYESSAMASLDRLAMEQAAQVARITELTGIGRYNAMIEAATAKLAGVDSIAGALQNLVLPLDVNRLLGDLTAAREALLTRFELPPPLPYASQIAEMSAHLKSQFELGSSITSILDTYAGAMERGLAAQQTEMSAAWRIVNASFVRLEAAYVNLSLDPIASVIPQFAEFRLPELQLRSHEAVLVRDDEEELVVVVGSASDALLRDTVSRVGIVSSRLGVKLEDAFAILRSKNRQKAEYACTTLRQVFFALLKKLAPVDRVTAWANRVNLDDAFMVEGPQKGQPTHRARLLYLSRHDLADNNTYSTFLRENAKSLLTLLRLINSQVHDEDPEEPAFTMTESRMDHVLVRTTAFFMELIICAEAQVHRERSN